MPFKTIEKRPVTLEAMQAMSHRIDVLTIAERERLMNWLLGSFAFQIYTGEDKPISEGQIHFWNSVSDFLEMHYSERFVK